MPKRPATLHEIGPMGLERRQFLTGVGAVLSAGDYLGLSGSDIALIETVLREIGGLFG